MEIMPHLGAQRQEQSKETNKDKDKDKKKNKNNRKPSKELEVKDTTTFDVVKTNVNKCMQELADGQWLRIYEIPFHNEYLENKLVSGSVFFYKNQKSGKLAFINRSLVDPNLNYNRGGFNSDLEDEKKL